VVTVIVALPAAIAVTRPELFTVATEVLLLLQLTFLLVASDGCTVAVSCPVCPTVKLKLVGLTVTPVTGIVDDPEFTVTFSKTAVEVAPSLWEVTANPI
jgi:hypothetical protein